jgi:pyrimidine-nucleoside phosphorylase
MRFIELIEKKRDGHRLNQAEITFFIEGTTKGTIPEYQLSALLMAIYFQGMDEEESFHLTKAILESGSVIDLSAIDGIKVDKHSTGGVGDKTTLALAPLVASMGAKMAKLSGRGLGHTGGTLDKLESIPGFNIALSETAFNQQVNTLGLALAGQTSDIAPADKLLYALRDVTGTVPSIPLIASSIMSKKLASGADVIVLDVKVGDGAFMKDIEEARKLSQLMIRIGEQYGKKVSAFLTNMSEPLGFAIGNRLEVIEAIQTLKNQGPEDFTNLVIELAAALTVKAGLFKDVNAAKKEALNHLKNGLAYQKFEAFVAAQGGDLNAFDALEVGASTAIYADRDGVVSQMATLELGLEAMHLGAGRQTKEDPIDPQVGLVVPLKVGDTIKKGDLMVTVYHQGTLLESTIQRIKSHVHLVNHPVQKPALILERFNI